MSRFQFTTLAAVTVIGFASIASAADMPVKVTPMKAPVPVAYDWTGFYLGIEGGGGWGTSHHGTATVPDFSDNFKVSGGIVGGTAGYNWQTGAFVIGVEGDVSYSALTGSTAGFAPIFCPDGTAASNCTTKLRGLETLRARFGYAWDRFLPFVTGGLAVGQIYGASDPGNVNFGSTNKATWTVGGGVEAAINRNWSVKAEYLYADFGTLSGLFIRNPGAFPFDVSLKTHIVRMGLNYRFN
jgi:outer membrane immunogenic protein